MFTNKVFDSGLHDPGESCRFGGSGGVREFQAGFNFNVCVCWIIANCKIGIGTKDDVVALPLKCQPKLTIKLLVRPRGWN